MKPLNPNTTPYILNPKQRGPVDLQVWGEVTRGLGVSLDDVHVAFVLVVPPAPRPRPFSLILRTL